MKKIILSLIFVILLSIPVYAHDYVIEYSILKQSAVSVFVEFDNGIGASCSGIVINKTESETEILTAGHCFDGNVVNIYVDTQYETKNYIVANDIDVAYINVPNSLIFRSPVKLAKKNAKLDEIILFLGYPNFQEYFEIGISSIIIGKNQYIFAKAIPGVSGSGVINRKGELVGIVWGSLNLGTVQQTIMTPIEKIYPFLNSLNISVLKPSAILVE